MTPVKIRCCNGVEVDLPIYDVMLSQHVARTSSQFYTLVAEINSDTYAPLFKDKADLTFLDLGANIGLVSIYAMPACRRIVAVEPDPDTHQRLRATTCPWNDKIEPVEAALSPRDGTVSFYQNDQNTTANSCVNTYGKKIEVQGLTLRSILRIHQLEKVSVCKVDIEGAEELALDAYELQMAAPIIDSYWIEVHNTPTARWRSTMFRLQSTLKYLGYIKQHQEGMRLLAWR